MNSNFVFSFFFTPSAISPDCLKTCQIVLLSLSLSLSLSFFGLTFCSLHRHGSGECQKIVPTMTHELMERRFKRKAKLIIKSSFQSKSKTLSTSYLSLERPLMIIMIINLRYSLLFQSTSNWSANNLIIQTEGEACTTLDLCFYPLL